MDVLEGFSSFNSRLWYDDGSAQKLSYRKFLTAFIRTMNVRRGDLNPHPGHLEIFLTSVPPSEVSSHDSYSFVLVPRLRFKLSLSLAHSVIYKRVVPTSE